MPARPALVTQAELKRSVAGVMAAGVKVGRVEIDHATGKVIIWPAGMDEVTGANPCDRLLK